jgi:hypothetical protein
MWEARLKLVRVWVCVAGGASQGDKHSADVHGALKEQAAQDHLQRHPRHGHEQPPQEPADVPPGQHVSIKTNTTVIVIVYFSEIKNKIKNSLYS